MGGVPIAAAFLAAFKARHRLPGLCLVVKSFHHLLALCSDPSPRSNQRRAPEQSRLHAETIETPHVLRRNDAAKMYGQRIRTVHGTSVAVPAAEIQRIS